jgi:hypothetical protein
MPNGPSGRRSLFREIAPRTRAHPQVWFGPIARSMTVTYPVPDLRHRAAAMSIGSHQCRYRRFEDVLDTRTSLSTTNPRALFTRAYRDTRQAPS